MLKDRLHVHSLSLMMFPGSGASRHPPERPGIALPPCSLFFATLWLLMALLVPGHPSRAGENRHPDSLVITYNKNNPPLKFQDPDGTPSGMLIDLWRLWGQKTGISISFREAPFPESLELVRSGRADIHAGLFYTAARDAYLDFSDPVLDINYYIFRREGLPALDTLDALLPFRIGVPKGYTHTFVRKHQPGAAIMVYDDFPALYRSALAGEISVFLSPVINLEYYLRKINQRNPFRYTPARPVYRRVYLAGVAQGRKQLLDLINQGLSKISREERTDLQRKWIGRSRGATSRERLIIACDSDFAPFTMLNARGEPAGLFIDLWKRWAQHEKIQVDFLFDDRAGSIRAVHDGLADFHSGLADDAPWMCSSKPFYRMRGMVFTPADRGIRSLLDLRGLRVGALDRSLEDRLFQALPRPRRIAHFPNYAELFSGLGRGELDAFIDEELVVANILFRQGRQGEFLRLPDFVAMESIAAVTNRKNRPLLERINRGLSAFSRTDFLDLEEKWLEEPGRGYYHRAGPRNNTPRTEEKEQQASPAPVLSDDEKRFLESHPVIRMGYDPEFFPFEFRGKDGSFKGMASDYIRILRERVGLQLNIVHDMSWHEVMEAVRQHKLDLVPCVGRTLFREKFLSFSRPYANFQRVIIARSDFPFIGRMADLKDVRVAVQANSSHVGFLRDTTELVPTEYPTLQESLTAVSRNKADVFIGNLASATYWIRKLQLTNLKVAAPAQQEKQVLCFGVRKDWPQLVSIINKGLATISMEEENTIYRRWVSVTYEPGLSPRLFRDYLLKAGAVFLVCLLGFWLWNYRLKQEVLQRKEAERKLHRYADELEKANRHLQSLDRLKSMFIASMSHELRTPLNSIIGFTGVILQGMTGEINPRQRDQLSRVYRSARHLLSLISDVIDISKIEAGRIDVFPTEFLLADVVEEALENIQPQLEHKELSLSVRVPGSLVLTTDRKRLLQVLINFLSNAVKFTEQGGITVEAVCESHQVRIAVTDTGIGIDEQHIPQLFEPFERLDSHLHIKAGGTGLGLYLTRKIAEELLGGTIEVQSIVGRGSTFSLVLPKILPVTEKERKVHAGTGD